MRGRSAGSDGLRHRRHRARPRPAFPDGDRLVIQGPTGGGKSTPLQMLGGLDRPTSGEVVLEGTDLAAPSIMVTHDSAIATKAPRPATIRRGSITVSEKAGA